MRLSRITLPILLLVLAGKLAAQEVRTIPERPPLPFGLTWTMTEREALAALKRAGMEPQRWGTGERLTARQIKEIVRGRGLSERTVRDAQTWKLYSCGSVRMDSTVPEGKFSIEFLRDRIFLVECYWKTESNEKHIALAEQLRSRYQSFYMSPSAGHWNAMPKFPPGQILYGNFLDMGVVPKEEERRPELFHGWSGAVGESVYGTMVYTSESMFLRFRQITGPYEKLDGRTR